MSGACTVPAPEAWATRGRAGTREQAPRRGTNDALEPAALAGHAAGTPMPQARQAQLAGPAQRPQAHPELDGGAALEQRLGQVLNRLDEVGLPCGRQGRQAMLNSSRGTP